MKPIATPKNKMGVLRILNLLHSLKRFGRNKTEPVFDVFHKHPVTRGMASYLFIWPFGCWIQQTITFQEKYDWWRLVRFGLYGALITAPCLYAWVKLSTSLYPNFGLRLACAKVSMTWLEGFSAVETWLEQPSKILPPYFIAITIWPLIGTINFAFIPERRRLLIVSSFYLLWSVFLYHLKTKERDVIILGKKTKELDDEEQQ